MLPYENLDSGFSEEVGTHLGHQHLRASKMLRQAAMMQFVFLVLIALACLLALTPIGK